MKNIGLFITLIILCVCGTGKAQTSAVKNAAKSVFKLTTYNADGSVLATSNGVFVGNNGEAISDLKPFIGAAKATVTDTKGREMNVERIMGINDLYDVANSWSAEKRHHYPWHSQPQHPVHRHGL